MIERIIEFSIRNRVLVILAGLALAVWGVYAVYHTPMDAIPDLSEYQVVVDPARLLVRGVILNDVTAALARSNSAVGGHVIHKANAEYIVRGVGWLGAAPGATESDPLRIVRDLENVVFAPSGGGLV